MTADLHRRRLLVGASALLAARAAGAQQRKPRIAIPSGGNTFYVETLKQGMREQGFPDAQVDYLVRSSAQASRYDEIVKELVALHPDVFVVIGPPIVRACLKATKTIPIVMANVSNPVGNGFIRSLARPGGNVTGIATQYETVLPKMAELLVQLVPTAANVAVLVNSDNPSTSSFWNAAESALRALHKMPLRINASSEAGVVAAFDQMHASGVQAAIVVVDLLFGTVREKVTALAQKAGIPAVYGVREFVVAGGLACYGPSVLGNVRASARYVAQILGGAKPADLPVEQPTKFDLVINLKTAKALGLTIPQSVLLQATEVIE
ncbi:MAG TPA: ABC transporter substrate-binding protein [Burkholderiales bacterium]|nr:ABC transporter substrate-binding protein [Burkholderiales bacterium]